MSCQAAPGVVSDMSGSPRGCVRQVGELTTRFLGCGSPDGVVAVETFQDDTAPDGCGRTGGLGGGRVTVWMCWASKKPVQGRASGAMVPDQLEIKSIGLCIDIDHPDTSGREET